MITPHRHVPLIKFLGKRVVLTNVPLGATRSKGSDAPEKARHNWQLPMHLRRLTPSQDEIDTIRVHH